MLVRLKAYQVDAFTDKLFRGNPAVVVILTENLPNETLLKIAAENAVPETAFILASERGYSLRWFTPDLEMDLCGHATLAAAHILFTEYSIDGQELKFETLSGELSVIKEGKYYLLNFPSRPAEPATIPTEIYESLSIKPQEAYKSRDYMLVYKNEEEILNIEIELSLFNQIDLGQGGVVITAPGKDCDFVSRFFTPRSTILEDPVTGSAHCTLAPYWMSRTNKKSMYAKQLSSRGGFIYCRVERDRVELKGKAITYFRGEINIPTI